MHRENLVLHVGAGDVARAEALLRLAGAESVALRDAAHTPVLEPQRGETPLWAAVEIHALFADGGAAAGVAAWLGRALPAAVVVRIETLGRRDWTGTQPLTPRPIGRRLAIVPADARAEPRGRTVIRLRMGLGFGTGEHPTTRLCLEWLERGGAAGARVVDYGCGSGVLAIAALTLGARFAWATDNDPQALQAAADNAELNGVTARIWIGEPAGLECRDADLVMANILARPLVELAGRFRDLLAPDGRIVLCGILDAQVEGVLSAYAPHFEAFERRSSAGWSLLTARRKSTSAAR